MKVIAKLAAAVALVSLPTLPSFVPSAIGDRYEDIKSTGWLWMAEEIRKTGDIHASNALAMGYMATNSKFGPGRARGEYLRNWATFCGVDSDGTDKQVRKRIVDKITNPGRGNDSQ